MHDLTVRAEEKKNNEAAKYAASQVPSRGQVLKARLSQNAKTTLLVLVLLGLTVLLVRQPYAVGKALGGWYNAFTSGVTHGLANTI